MEGQRTVLVYVPNEEYVDELKVIHDPAKLVKALRFSRKFTHEVENIENSKNCGVYILLNESNEVYVGKSVNGVIRIREHLYGEKNWDEAILFVTETNRFDGLAIDYLEHRFIQIFLESRYEVVNADYRLVKPTVNYTNELTFNSYENEIRFLLKFLGIDIKKIVDLQEVVNEGKQGVKARKKERVERYGYGDVDDGVELRFEPVNETYTEPVYYIDGRFVLKEGAVIKYPDGVDGVEMGRFRIENEYLINSMVSYGKAKKVDGLVILLEDVEFSSPSTVAGLITGREKNGWSFYEGIRQVKRKMY